MRNCAWIFSKSESIIIFPRNCISRVGTFYFIPDKQSLVTYNPSNFDLLPTETLRKYPPAPFINRVCTEAYKLPGSSFTLEPGTRVTLVPYSIHHDEQFYPNPKKFDPERFTPENIEARPPFTYLPFGDGPRMCIGTYFKNIFSYLVRE